MTERAEVIRALGDWSDDELRTVMATLAGIDSAKVCDVAAVIVFHPAPGEHELRVITSLVGPSNVVASLLSHAARHCFGGCKPCRTRNAKGGKRA